MPIELIALGEPDEGGSKLGAVGEPGFSHVQYVADGIMAALSRGVDLVAPAAISQRSEIASR